MLKKERTLQVIRYFYMKKIATFMGVGRGGKKGDRGPPWIFIT